MSITLQLVDRPLRPPMDAMQYLNAKHWPEQRFEPVLNCVLNYLLETLAQFSVPGITAIRVQSFQLEGSNRERVHFDIEWKHRWPPSSQLYGVAVNVDTTGEFLSTAVPAGTRAAR